LVNAFKVSITFADFGKKQRNSNGAFQILRAFGSRLHLWHDVWCRNQPLKIQFPDLFRIALLKNVTVQDVVSWNGSVIGTFLFKKPNDWEEDNMCDFLETLAEINLLPEGIYNLPGHTCLKAFSLLRVFVKSFMLMGIVQIFPSRAFGSLKSL